MRGVGRANGARKPPEGEEQDTMPSRLRYIVVPLLALLALPGVVAAQPPAATPGAAALGALDGVERAVMRTYAFDVTALASALSTPEGSTRAPEGLIFLYGVVAEFATPGQAASAMTPVERQVADALTGDGAGGPRFTPRASAVADLGEEAVRWEGNAAGPRATLAGYIVRDGAWLYLSIAVATDDAAEPAARAVVDYALTQQAGEDAGEHRPDGSSEGGLWAKLPIGGEVAGLEGVRPVVDTVLVPGGTP